MPGGVTFDVCASLTWVKLIEIFEISHHRDVRKMDDPPKENSKLCNIRDWQWSILLFVLMLLYLVLGAFIFRATEYESSSQAQTKLYQGIFDFIEGHKCVNPLDLQDFANELTSYLSQGASLKKRYWIDRDEEEIESRWILTRAFVFSLTIITTIGEYVNLSKPTIFKPVGWICSQPLHYISTRPFTTFVFFCQSLYQL